MKTGAQSGKRSISTSVFSLCCTGLLVSACSKAPPESNTNTPAPAPVSAAATSGAPTGLVKNPVNHSQVADVTQWMDKASTKTAAQLAQEEKLAREAKEKQAQQEAAKKAQESKQVAAKPASQAKETPAPAPVVAATPVAVVTKAPEPAPVVAKAAEPAPAPVKAAEPEKVVLKLVSGAQPKFPNAAVRSGYTEGTVSARVHIEPDGKVSQVEILKAKPSKFFDREVTTAVSQWKYAPIPRASTTTVEFTFHLD